jgi:hypothetical protein
MRRCGLIRIPANTACRGLQPMELTGSVSFHSRVNAEGPRGSRDEGELVEDLWRIAVLLNKQDELLGYPDSAGVCSRRATARKPCDLPQGHEFGPLPMLLYLFISNK